MAGKKENLLASFPIGNFIPAVFPGPATIGSITYTISSAPNQTVVDWQSRGLWFRVEVRVHTDFSGYGPETTFSTSLRVAHSLLGVNGLVQNGEPVAHWGPRDSLPAPILAEVQAALAVTERIFAEATELTKHWNTMTPAQRAALNVQRAKQTREALTRAYQERGRADPGAP